MKLFIKVTAVCFVFAIALSVFCINAYSQAGDHSAKGTIESIENDSLTVKMPDDTTLTLLTPDYVSYTVDGQQSTKDQLKAGMKTNVQYYAFPDKNTLTHITATSNTQE